MGVASYKKLQILFRRGVGLDIDKSKAERIIEHTERVLRDMFDIAMEKAERRKAEEVVLDDIPLTKGIKEYMKKFHEIEEEIDVEPIIAYLKLGKWVPLSKEVVEILPELVGTLLLLSGRVIKTISEDTRKPTATEVEKALSAIDLIL